MSPPKKLQVIALISGGKDSLFSLLHCLHQGHSIVALANLYPAPPPSPSPSSRSSASGLSVPPAATADHETDNGNENASETEDEDSDSYMYQTVSHPLIPLYATALQLPLYRQPIAGAALNTAAVYDPGPTSTSTPTPTSASTAPSNTASAAAEAAKAEVEELDETESLLPLLTHILAHHPTATALSAGAILSTYQRTRIESVALRLGLVPLAFLWQWPALPSASSSSSAPGCAYAQGGLLRDIGAVGQESRIVKVASGGLDEGDLWVSVGEDGVGRRLGRAVGRFAGRGEGEGGAVLGEGGEYETMTLRGPRPLWKGRIEVPEEGRVVVKGEAGSAALRITGARVVMEDDGGEEQRGMKNLRVPQLLDTEFASVLGSLRGRERGVEEMVAVQSLKDKPALAIPPFQRSKIGKIRTVSNIMDAYSGAGIEDQMASIISMLRTALRNLDLTPSDIVFATILLRSGSDFQAVNRIYGELFTRPNPPARVTVACEDALPEGVQVVLSVELDVSQPAIRKGLHVQSRSYWAPANIGPYSQAICVPLVVEDDEHGSEEPEMLYVAGQIPLVPASMELLGGEGDDGPAETGETNEGAMQSENKLFERQAVLALQHLWRIGRATKVNWWTGGVAFIVGSSSHEVQRRAITAAETWKTTHELSYAAASAEQEPDETEAVDVWDLKYRRASILSAFDADVDTRPPLPRWSHVPDADAATSSRVQIPPLFVVEVAELPREASIEWASTGIANGRVRVHELAAHDGLRVSWCAVSDTGMFHFWAAIETGPQFLMLTPAIEGVLGPERKYYPLDEEHVTLYASNRADISAEWLMESKAQVVPCRTVWDASGKQILAGVVVRIDAHRQRRMPLDMRRELLNTSGRMRLGEARAV